MKNKIVIFDLDGVLVDSVAMGRDSILYQYPDAHPEIHKMLHSGNFHEELSKIGVAKRVETEEEQSLRKQKYLEKKTEAPFYAGVVDLLTDLHSSGLILALNTSAYSPACVPCLTRHGVIDFFDYMGTADISRSKVEKFKLIKEKYNTDFSEMIFVTDTIGDLKEASIVGIPTVGVTWGVHDLEDFKKDGWDNLVGIAHTVDELKTFLF